MKPLGKYGKLHRDQLEANRPELFGEMTDEELETVCLAVQTDAAAMKQQLLDQGVGELSAEEMVLHDLVLVPDEEFERARQHGGYTD